MKPTDSHLPSIETVVPFKFQPDMYATTIQTSRSIQSDTKVVVTNYSLAHWLAQTYGLDICKLPN